MSEQPKIPGLDDLLQDVVVWKEALNDCYNALAEIALVFVEMGKAGDMASHLTTSTQEINTWADVYATFGENAIQSTDPLDARWWRSILKTGDPARWLEEARARQLSAAQIRAEAGVQRERKPPVYVGSGTLAGETVYLDSEPMDKARRRVGVRLMEQDE